MKIVAAGSGSAFTMKNYQSNFFIEENGKRLLIDAGGDIRWALKDLNLSYKDFEGMYLTHQHADHLGGIEWLAFCTLFDPSCLKPILFGHGKMLHDAWNDSLKGGLRSIQGKCVGLDDYFDVRRLKDNTKFFWQDIAFKPVQSVHIMDGYSIVPSYGLMIEPVDSDERIYFTSDTQFNPNQIIDFYKQASVIIQDCETAPFKSGVHAHYDELCTLDDNIKNKMWLFHYQDNVMDDWDVWREKAQKDGFRGFIAKGKVIDLSPYQEKAEIPIVYAT